VAYIPTTPDDRRAMLARIGVADVEALFADIPAELRVRGLLDVPPALSEMELRAELDARAARNRPVSEFHAFLGGGAYDHFVPAAARALVGKPEFFTAYTPYQAEVSQGLLQSIYEFQSLLVRLTGMEVANASLYDGATALAEAIFMAHAANERTEVVLPRNLHPHWRQVVATQMARSHLSVREVGFVADGTIDRAALGTVLSERTAAVVFASPNFFGAIEPGREIVAAAHAAGALAIHCFHPTSLALLATPGELGADIAVAEGQPLGIPLSFGGPYVGLFCARKEHVRRMPGRLIGRTRDAQGRRAFVMTLQTREQHIRRAQATSNVCTNQALCAFAATVYLSLLGPRGLRAVAETAFARAHALLDALVASGVARRRFAAPFWNEFVLDIEPALWRRGFLDEMRARGILAGIPLGAFDPALEGALLVAATETTREESIRAYADAAASLAGARPRC
jgi:glycine dehydrogenase subunit 1